MSDARTREALRRARAEGGHVAEAAAEAARLRAGLLVECAWCHATVEPDTLCCDRVILDAWCVAAAPANVLKELVREGLMRALDAAMGLHYARHGRSVMAAVNEQLGREGSRPLVNLDRWARGSLAAHVVAALGSVISGGIDLARAVQRCCLAAENPELLRCGWLSADRHMSCDLDEGHDGECEFA